MKHLHVRKLFLCCVAMAFFLAMGPVHVSGQNSATGQEKSFTKKALDLLKDYKEIRNNVQELLSPGATGGASAQSLSLTSDVARAYQAASLMKGGPDASRNTIFMKLKNVELKDVLRNLAEEMGLTLSLTPGIQEKISVNFDHISPEQALQRIAEDYRLRIQKVGRVLHVSRETTTNAETWQKFATYIVPLRNISAEDALVAINTLLSERGSVAINQQANILLVHDTEDRIENIKKIMPAFDPEPKQISVEGAILEVNRTNKTTIGFNWFGTDSTVHGSKKVWGNLDARGFAFPPNETSTAVFTTILYGSIGTFLEAIKANENVEILSSPRILVTEGHEARIIVGKKLGYRTTATTASQTTMENIQFLEVGTQLTVTPFILDDKTIIMDIHPEVSNGTVDATGLPNVNTSEATTRVMIEEGQTLVIGGLINKKVVKNVKKVPLLGSIPLLGRLFRRSEDEIIRSEMIVLISPHFVGEKPDPVMKRNIDKVNRFKSKRIFK